MRFTDNAELTAANMTNTDILAGTDVSTQTDKKFSLAGLADWFLNRFTGLSLAGNNQSVKAALDGLNSTLSVQFLTATANLDNVAAFFASASSGAIASAITNSPTTNAFVMITIAKSSSTYTQILTDSSQIYVRTRNSSGWLAWYRYNGTVVS